PRARCGGRAAHSASLGTSCEGAGSSRKGGTSTGCPTRIHSRRLSRRLMDDGPYSVWAHAELLSHNVRHSRNRQCRVLLPQVFGSVLPVGMALLHGFPLRACSLATAMAYSGTNFLAGQCVRLKGHL